MEETRQKLKAACIKGSLVGRQDRHSSVCGGQQGKNRFLPPLPGCQQSKTSNVAAQTLNLHSLHTCFLLWSSCFVGRCVHVLNNTSHLLTRYLVSESVLHERISFSTLPLRRCAAPLPLCNGSARGPSHTTLPRCHSARGPSHTMLPRCHSARGPSHTTLPRCHSARGPSHTTLPRCHSATAAHEDRVTQAALLHNCLPTTKKQSTIMGLPF